MADRCICSEHRGFCPPDTCPLIVRSAENSRPSRLPTRVVKRIDTEMFSDDGRHLQQQAQCPACGIWGDVDEDQVRGSVSLICPECGWHGFIEEQSRG